MTNGTKVKKRNGAVATLDLDKVHKMVEKACDGLAAVSASQVEIQSGIQFYDGITTEEIQEILIKSANDLISLDNPNYQFVAARLLLFGLTKQVYGGKEYPTLEGQILGAVGAKVYDHGIYDKYSLEEIHTVESFIDHYRDLLLSLIHI